MAPTSARRHAHGSATAVLSPADSTLRRPAVQALSSATATQHVGHSSHGPVQLAARQRRWPAYLYDWTMVACFQSKLSFICLARVCSLSSSSTQSFGNLTRVGRERAVMEPASEPHELSPSQDVATGQRHHTQAGMRHTSPWCRGLSAAASAPDCHGSSQTCRVPEYLHGRPCAGSARRLPVRRTRARRGRAGNQTRRRHPPQRD